MHPDRIPLGNLTENPGQLIRDALEMAVALEIPFQFDALDVRTGKTAGCGPVIDIV